MTTKQRDTWPTLLHMTAVKYEPTFSYSIKLNEHSILFSYIKQYTQNTKIVPHVVEINKGEKNALHYSFNALTLFN